MSECDSSMSRRKLFARTSQAALAAVGGGVLAKTTGCGPQERPMLARAPENAVNYNPQMKYRRLGKTELIVSEISLGGHWKKRDGGRVWTAFASGEVPDDVAKNRTEVMSACIDAGINYLDITTGAECLAYGAALKGRREKMIVGADDHRRCIRNFDNATPAGQTRNVDECLRQLDTDYLDIWRVQAKMDGSSQDPHVEACIEAAGEAIKAGKILHFGISSHNRDWLKHVIETYPEVEMVIFPCTAKTREAGLPVTRENIVEQAGWKNAKDFSTSIFASLRERDIGLVTIKPFAGGALFKTEAKFPVMGVGVKEENDLARLTLQCILASHDEISCIVPGLTTIYEVENAAKVSYQREMAMSPAEEQWLEQATDQAMASLPEEYAWLRNWDVV